VLRKGRNVTRYVSQEYGCGESTPFATTRQLGNDTKHTHTLGHVLVQFMIVWQRYMEKGSRSWSMRSSFRES
jgi:hypothetical protein